VDRIDHDNRQVHVNLTKDQVRQAPDYEKGQERDEKYRKDVGSYYSPYFRS
jgi:stress response protein YsnF